MPSQRLTACSLLDDLELRLLNRGLAWEREEGTMSAEAAAYQAGAPNPYADKGLVPSLRYDNPLPGKGRKNVVRFDGIEGKTLIDRKLSFYSSEDGKDQLLRQSEAIKDNPGYSLRIEVPNKVQERRVDKYLKKLGITNIAIKVVAP